MAVFFKATSDFDDVMRDYDKLTRKVQSLKEENQQLTKEVKGGGDQTDRFFSSQSSSLASLLTGWASIQGAIDLVGGALHFAQQETDAAVSSMEKLTDERRRLAQLSLTGAALDSRDKRADELAMQFGVDRGEARNVLVDATAMGAESSLPSIFKYADVLAPEVSTQAAGKLPMIFKGELNSAQAMAMTHAGSIKSPLDFEALMESMPTAAQGVKAAGGSPAETASLVALLSEGTANKTEAGTLLKELGVKIGVDSKGTFGETKGIVDAVKQLEAMPAEKRRAFLAESQGANNAYQMILEKMPAIEAQTLVNQRAIETAGTSESPLEQARLANFDPTKLIGQKNLAALEMRKSAIYRAVINENRFAVSGARATGALDEGMGHLDASTTDLFGKFAGWSAGGTAKLAGLPSDDVEGITAGVGGGFSFKALMGLGGVGDTPLKAMIAREKQKRQWAAADDAGDGQHRTDQHRTDQDRAATDKHLAVLLSIDAKAADTNEQLKRLNTGAAGHRETR